MFDVMYNGFCGEGEGIRGRMEAGAVMKMDVAVGE